MLTLQEEYELLKHEYKRILKDYRTIMDYSLTLEKETFALRKLVSDYEEMIKTNVEYIIEENYQTGCMPSQKWLWPALEKPPVTPPFEF